MIIHSTLAIPVVAIATVATIVFIGLAFLRAPSRHTVLWSTGFATAMIASYLWIAADIAQALPLRALASGLILAPMALMWSGLRAYRGARLHLWVPLVFLAVMPTALVLASFTPLYGATFRVLFAVTAVFAALTVIELVRLGPAVRDGTLPMMAAAALFIVFAVIVLVDGVLQSTGTGTADGLAFVRTVNLVGATVYIVCNLVTTLQLATRSGPTPTSTTHGTFDSVARGRLRRAEEHADPWWSLLDIRLDDPDDIRAASGTAAFSAISESFADDVYATLPADADVERMSPTRFIALVPRSQGGMREILSVLLERVSTLEEHQAIPIRLSASIGWAQATSTGYDLHALLDAASEAAVVAHAEGGDRWERVRGEG